MIVSVKWNETAIMTFWMTDAQQNQFNVDINYESAEILPHSQILSSDNSTVVISIGPLAQQPLNSTIYTYSIKVYNNAGTNKYNVKV